MRVQSTSAFTLMMLGNPSLRHNHVLCSLSPDEHRASAPTRRLLVTLSGLAASQGLLLSSHALSADPDSAAAAYAAGARAGGGRGANALLRTRAESGIQRIGGNPIFKPGLILDSVRSEDGSAVDISFSYPEAWAVSKGPNLDVRDLRTGDSAFLLGAPLRPGQTLEELPKSFFTTLLFAQDGKYGAYGGVDEFSVSKFELVSLKSPSGVTCSYRRLSIRFSALTYNANTVQRRALLSATSLGGTVFVFVAGCLSNRFKEAEPELEAIRSSFRAVSSSGASKLANSND